MDKLQVINHNSIDAVDSREVAEMIGKQHAHLMRDIKGYADIIENSNESRFGLVDFFILGSFVGRPFLLSTNPLYPCNLYLCTH